MADLELILLVADQLQTRPAPAGRDPQIPCEMVDIAQSIVGKAPRKDRNK